MRIALLIALLGCVGCVPAAAPHDSMHVLARAGSTGVVANDPPDRIAEAAPFINTRTTRQGITITSDRGTTVP